MNPILLTEPDGHPHWVHVEKVIHWYSDPEQFDTTLVFLDFGIVLEVLETEEEILEKMGFQDGMRGFGEPKPVSPGLRLAPRKGEEA